VKIVYAPDAPSVSRLQGKLQPPFFLLGLSCMGGLFVVVGVVLLGSGWQSVGRASALKWRGKVI
jgi:hypothetical protein